MTLYTQLWTQKKSRYFWWILYSKWKQNIYSWHWNNICVHFIFI